MEIQEDEKKEKKEKSKLVRMIESFNHHYLFDTIFSTFIFACIIIKGLQVGYDKDYDYETTLQRSLLVGVAFLVFYWFVFRRLYIKYTLRIFRRYYKAINLVYERIYNKLWKKKYKELLDFDESLKDLPVDEKSALLKFLSETHKEALRRKAEMKEEAKNKQKKASDYAKSTLLMLNFNTVETYKICAYVDFFIETKSAPESPEAIAKHDDVSIAELKNLMANIADQFDIPNKTTAEFITKVFKEWCVWGDANGKEQTTEVSTIAKTLRTTKGKLRVLPENIGKEKTS